MERGGEKGRKKKGYPLKNKCNERNSSFLGVVVGSSFSGVVGVGWGREGVEHQKRAKTARR